MKGHIISEKERELINLATSLAAGCQPCMRYHLRKCRDRGLSAKEISEIIHLTSEIYNRAFEIMSLQASALVTYHLHREPRVPVKSHHRTELMIGLAVSFTINSTELSEHYISYAKQFEVSDPEISLIMEISRSISGKARAHVEISLEDRGVENQNTAVDNGKCGCGC